MIFPEQDYNSIYGNHAMMQTIVMPRSRFFLSLIFCLAAALPAWAGWHSLGAMPPGVRRGNGVEYRNGQGVVRIYVISPGVIRVRFVPARLLPAWARHLPAGRPAPLGRDHSYAVTAPPSGHAAFQWQSQGATDTLRTAQLRVVIERAPFRLQFFDAQGHVLAQDTRAGGISYQANGAVRDWQRLTPADHIFGLGEKTGPLDKRNLKLGGSALAMWNADVPDYGDATDPLYSDIPFFLELRAGVAHGVFFDNTWRTYFDVGKASRRTLAMGAAGGELNYYLIAGPTPRQVLRRYTRLTGRMPLPPLWVLGYNQCRWSYSPAAIALHIARRFRQLRIPADTLWLDIAYMRGYRVFSWSPKRFPHPRQFLARMHGMGFHVVTILDPGIKVDPGYPVYRSGQREDIFVKYPSGREYIGPVWPGPAAFPDFTWAHARAWWARQVARFAQAGVDGLWNDMDEPSVFNTASGTMPNRARFENRGRTTESRAVHNVFGQQMSRASQLGLRELRPNRRPFVLTRSTYAGGQRYAALWTGDIRSDWVHLRHGVTTLLGLGISGFPFVGNDIGGFIGKGSPNLWTRWVEAGAFFPFMRAHYAQSPGERKEPWVWGRRHTKWNRRAIDRRYEYLPYIYNAFYRASRTGMPVMRALLLDYPRERATYTVGSEYLFGRDLLIAPILRAHRSYRSVYFPAGRWYRVHSAQVIQGPRRLRVTAALGQIPLFVRAGGIVFRAPVMQNTAAWPAAPLIFDIYSGHATHRSYYEDDGATFNYRHGVYFKRQIEYMPGAAASRVVLTQARGTYQPHHACNQIWLHNQARPGAVRLNGRPLARLARPPHAATAAPFGWWYNPSTRELRVVIPQAASKQVITIRP